MALNVSKTQTKHPYIPYDQRGEEVKDPVELTIRTLLPQEQATLDDMLTRVYQDQSVSINQGSYNYQVCKVALVNWTNVSDEKGKAVGITRIGSVISDDSLNLLPIEWITEIANVITSITRAPEDTELFLGNVDVKTK